VDRVNLQHLLGELDAVATVLGASGDPLGPGRAAV
jgi:hypothetical protein